MRRKDLFLRWATGVHRAVFTVSRGRLLGSLAGMPVVKLVTTGRRSGRPRSTMLTVPVLDPDRVVLVASFGGDDRHPVWYRNLRDDPRVRITSAGVTRAMVARTADDDERAELWPRIIARYRGYAAYQRRTGRTIPVVILEPPPNAA